MRSIHTSVHTPPHSTVNLGVLKTVPRHLLYPSPMLVVGARGIRHLGGATDTSKGDDNKEKI